MNGQFHSKEAAIRYHLMEGFRVGVALCECLYSWACILHSENLNEQKIQCPKCGKRSSKFRDTHTLTPS